jgi:hypothetical protein
MGLDLAPSINSQRSPTRLTGHQRTNPGSLASSASGSGTSGCICVPTRRSNNGEAISVVTTAMMTSVAKSPSEIIPRWRPILMMINSINPRAFINVPMPSAWRFGTPVAHAASHTQRLCPPPRRSAPCHTSARGIRNSAGQSSCSNPSR